MVNHLRKTLFIRFLKTKDTREYIDLREKCLIISILKLCLPMYLKKYEKK